MAYLVEVIVVGLVLCVDSFSAALAMGARSHTHKDSLKFACASGGAEALVAFLGALAGAQIVSHFDHLDHWIAFFLLSFVAIHMFYEGWEDLKSDEKADVRDFHSFTKILVVSFATSLDAFAVGVSLGVSEKPLSPFIVSIGGFAFVTTLLGMAFSKKAAKKMGPVFSLVGAFILLGLAFKFLIEGF